MGADFGEVKRNNMEMVLRHLAVLGSSSRAAIAARSGLTRTTLSRLVGELIEMGLVCEVGSDRTGRSGRPGTLLELDGRHVLAVGAEINVDSLTVIVRDMAGREVARERRPLDAPAAGVEASVGALARFCEEVVGGSRNLAGREHARVVGLGVAIPGLVDTTRGVVVEAPNLHWHDAPVAKLLAESLGWDQTAVRVGNDANLGALAEFRIGSRSKSANLVYVTGEVGIGAGIIMGGQLVSGPRGYGGEVGHVSLDPDGPECGCGRRGCWEALIGLNALFRAVGLPRPRRGKPEPRVAGLARRAARGDSVVLDGLAGVGRWVGVGAGNLVNILGSEVVVLGGYFQYLGEWILPVAREALAAQTMVETDPAQLLTVSGLGFEAAALGAAIQVMEAAFSNPLED